jgi:RNase adaptor protein for sRNA GlmZ degradation
MLRIRIFSFSYLRSGIPEDETANGGGFVFDCRGFQNPGIIAEFMNLTGKDKPVIEILENNKEMQTFMKDVFEIVDLTVDNFIGRGFTDLMVSFGCTGGQHRSVYAAERLKEHLKKKYNELISVVLKHRDLI